MQIKCTGIFNDQNPIGLSQGYAGRRLEVDKQAIFDEMDLHSGLRSNPVASPPTLGKSVITYCPFIHPLTQTAKFSPRMLAVTFCPITNGISLDLMAIEFNNP